MELNFDLLDNIKKATGGHGEPQESGNFEIDTTTPININDYPKIKQDIKARRQKQDFLFKLQENIKKTERLRIDINKDIAAGADSTDILLKAIECISLMTGDKAFKEANVKKILEDTGRKS